MEYTFQATEIERIVEHMNSDHADSVLTYAHHFAQRSEADKARLVTLNASTLTIEAWIHEEWETLEIHFEQPLTSAHDAHMTLVKMSKDAKRALAQAK